MKRKIALAMVLAMTATMAQPVLAADDKTTLDVIISQYGTQTQAWWTQFEKDFEAENPDIDLNLEVISWNDLATKVNTLIANNSAPDILNIDVLADYVADDLLMPATEYTSDELQAKFFPAFWDASNIDDTVYALPILASCRALFYNKDILDEAGAAVPTTWAELQDAAKKIKDKFGDDVYPWGIDMTTDEGQAAFSYYTWNNGGGFVDENGVMPANQWVIREGVWYFTYSWGGARKSQWFYYKNNWYYFNDDASMQTGWAEIDGKTYYFQSWGGCVTGTKKIDGTTYVFDKNGVLLSEKES